MTQEEKTLITMALGGYFPYGLKLWDRDSEPGVEVIKFTGITDLHEVVTVSDEHGNFDIPLEDIKLILRPLSCLTQPITQAHYNDGKPFVPIVELAKAAEPVFFTENGLNISSKTGKYGCGFLSPDNVSFAFAYLSEEKSFFICNERGDRVYMDNMIGLFDLMNRLKIDYRGLIDKALAVADDGTNY